MNRLSLAGLVLMAALAQGEVGDADLQAASEGRIIQLGAAAGTRVTAVPMELYIARVLAGEAEPDAPDATLQALAIAIRTFAVVNAGRHRRDGFDLCDATHCQVPRTATAATRRAALATAGRILTWRGVPAEVFYSASCGGRSEAAADIWPRADLPYLQSVEDDVHDDDVEWTLELTLEQIQRALGRVGFEGRLREVRVEERTQSGRVARLAVEGLRPDVVAGDPFRLAVGPTAVRSTAFSLAQRGNTVRFTGRGYGHGVGMCVVGAARRARRGENAEAILAQYYPGLTVVRIGDLASSVSSGRIPAAAPEAPRPASAPAEPRRVTVRVSPGSAMTPAALEKVVASAQTAMAAIIEVPVTPVTVNLHDSLESFRAVTGKPWWVSAVAEGATIELAPAALLAQREGLEMVVRMAIAESLLAPRLAGKPAWIRVGGARYFARAAASSAPPARDVRCPAEAELTLAISAGAQREAEARAEACFARAFARTRDWRTVK